LLGWLYQFFSLDGQREEIQVLEVATGSRQAVLGQAHLASFSPDGKTLAVAGTDGSVRLYDLPWSAPWWRVLGWSAAAATGAWVVQHLAGRVRRNPAAGTRESHSQQGP
jgi:hypothetical protein